MTPKNMTAPTSTDAGDVLKTGARIGLVAYGVVHLLVAWIALQVAWSSGGEGDQASQSGALAMLADDGFGKAILWITAVGMVALVLWQLTDAIWGFDDEDGAKKAFKKGSAVAKAVIYGVLAFTAAKLASGSGGSSGGDGKEEGMTASLMGAPAGRWLVALVGVVIFAIGIYQGYKGVSKSFTHDLQDSATSGSSGTAIVRLGQAGYIAKGVAFVVLGVLFVFAAIDHDPKKAGGLDDALRTLQQQPFGPWILSLVALGLAAFGLYCFGWARYVKRR